jgi:hypothetical protein
VSRGLSAGIAHLWPTAYGMDGSRNLNDGQPAFGNARLRSWLGLNRGRQRAPMHSKNAASRLQKQKAAPRTTATRSASCTGTSSVVPSPWHKTSRLGGNHSPLARPPVALSPRAGLLQETQSTVHIRSFCGGCVFSSFARVTPPPTSLPSQAARQWLSRVCNNS